MTIILTGSKASGKSTIGRDLGGLLELRVVETDTITERLYCEQYGVQFGCREICAEHGEPFFRDLEHEAVFEALRQDRALICTGGQTMIDARCRKALTEAGLVVLLMVEFGTIWQRIVHDGYPSYFPLTNQKSWFETRVAEFRRLVTPVADVICDVDALTPDQATQAVAARIAAWHGTTR